MKDYTYFFQLTFQFVSFLHRAEKKREKNWGFFLLLDFSKLTYIPRTPFVIDFSIYTLYMYRRAPGILNFKIRQFYRIYRIFFSPPAALSAAAPHRLTGGGDYELPGFSGFAGEEACTLSFQINLHACMLCRA